ncbi:MFS transporter [Actinomadura opuntiae]|uniref:MFS transporter n=1 Tax=Actinomadura sp. OS1-43 TaxID=604315 RepID=UPI00255AFB79|nr:MFS transporter [Actinomadura sp. OS1-43]MDL4813280.1 MFS transporter [Actinomadura sp. OS1-43]
MTTTPVPAPATGRGQTGVLILGCLVFLVDGYDLYSLGTVGPSLLHYQAWGAGSGTLGMLGSVTALSMPFGSVLAGWGADRMGRRTPLAIAMGWISLSMLGTAIAPTLALFAAGRFCTGLGIGALAPLVSAYATDGAPPRRRTLHLAIVLGFVPVGGSISGLLGRLLLPGLHFQWLFLFGAVPALLVPVIWRMVPAGRTADADTGEAGRERTRLAELFVPGSRRGTVLFAVTSFMSMVLVFSTTSWLPTVMMKSGYDLSSSLEFSIAFTIGASVGGLGVSLLADRGHLKFVTLGSFLLAAAALYTLSTPQPRPVLLVVSALAGLGSLNGLNLLISCMSAFYRPRLRGTGLGFGLGVGRIGAIAGPSYVSAVTALVASPKAGFVAFMVPAVLGAATLALLPRRLSPPAGDPVSAPEAAPVVP